MYRRALNEESIDEVIDLMIRTEGEAERIRQRQAEITKNAAKLRLLREGVTVEKIYQKKKEENEHTLIKRFFTTDQSLKAQATEEYNNRLQQQMNAHPQKQSLEEFILSTVERNTVLTALKEFKQQKNNMFREINDELHQLIKEEVTKVKAEFNKANERRNAIRRMYFEEMKKTDNKEYAAGLYLKMRNETKRVNNANRDLINKIKQCSNELATNIIKGKATIAGFKESEYAKNIVKMQTLYNQRRNEKRELDLLDEMYGIYGGSDEKRVNMKGLQNQPTFVQDKVVKALKRMKDMNEAIQKQRKNI
jgi:hypothetical protein